MFLMYVDESGDPGLLNSMSKAFVLSGIVVHESKWKNFIDDLVLIRKQLHSMYKINPRQEFHTNDFLRRPIASDALGLSKRERLYVIRQYAKELSKLDYLRITNVIVHKSGKSSDYDVFEFAWRFFFQRFENTIIHGNFPHALSSQEKGLIFCDQTNGQLLRKVVRKMLKINYIPSQFDGSSFNKPLESIIEEPVMKDSMDSLPIQAADLVAWLTYQHFYPCAQVRKHKASNYIQCLEPILNSKASTKHPLGIVEL